MKILIAADGSVLAVAAGAAGLVWAKAGENGAPNARARAERLAAAKRLDMDEGSVG